MGGRKRIRSSAGVCSLMPIYPAPTPAPEGWKTPTMQNYWVHWGEGANVPGYWKDPHGVVHLRGLVRSGTVGQAIFTLPAGYRPVAREVFSVVSQATGSSSLAVSRCDVTSAGEVLPITGGNSFFSLDGISFRATT